MKHLACIAWVSGVVYAPTAAHAEDLSYQLETSIASGYVARGIVQYASGNDASSQNTAALRIDHVGPGAVSFTLWNAIALADHSAQPGTALEIDACAAYGFNAGPVALTAGYTAYLFPSHAEGAPIDGGHEIYGTAAYANPYVVPTVGLWIEPVRQQGVYVTVGGSHDFHHHRWTFSPAITVGAAAYRKYLGSDQVAAPHLNDVTAGFASRVDLAGGVYAAARVSYAIRATPDDLMGDAMDTSMGLGGRSTLVGLLAVGVAR